MINSSRLAKLSSRLYILQEMVDKDFFDEPRILMGLNKRHRTDLRSSEEDEENHFRRPSLNDTEKAAEGVAHIERQE